MTELDYAAVRPVLARVADLGRELVLVGGQAVNFWASFYEERVPILAQHGPFTSKDIDFCGDASAVRRCAERLGGVARIATLDDATPNIGTVLFVDAAGVRRTLDVVAAPYGLQAEEVRLTAIPIEFRDDSGKPTGGRIHVLHPVLSMESRVHNVVGLAAAYDTEQGRKQVRASIVCAHEFLRDVIDGRLDSEAPERTARKLNERIYRFCMRDAHAKELYRATGVDPARALVDHPRLEQAFREVRLPQMREGLARRATGPWELRTAERTLEPPTTSKDKRGGPER